ncbi:MAG: hypothetical protein WB646_20535 [Steroidobacteraceae bacterium]
MKPAAPQPHHIESDHRIALRCQRERRDIPGNPCATADHYTFTDPAELVYYGAPTEKYPITNVHMARQEHRICDYDAFADATIVSHVAGGHEKAIRAYFGKVTRLRCATDCDMFTNDGSRTDPHAGNSCLLEAEILRVAADYGKRMNHDAVAELGVPADNRVGVDDAALSEPGSFLDQSCRMNLHGLSLGVVMAVGPVTGKNTAPWSACQPLSAAASCSLPAPA